MFGFHESFIFYHCSKHCYDHFAVVVVAAEASDGGYVNAKRPFRFEWELLLQYWDWIVQDLTHLPMILARKMPHYLNQHLTGKMILASLQLLKDRRRQMLDHWNGDHFQYTWEKCQKLFLIKSIPRNLPVIINWKK